MSATEATRNASRNAGVGSVDTKLEAVVIPVSDVDRATALLWAEAAHGEHETRTGERDENWPAWYAAYMLAEQTGDELPS
jgi:hypothetical protein